MGTTQRLGPKRRARNPRLRRFCMSEYVHRFDGATALSNGHVSEVLPGAKAPKRRHGRQKPSAKSAPSRHGRSVVDAHQRANFWCTTYVVAALGTSAFLN